MFRTSDLLVIGGLAALAYYLYTKVGLPGGAAVNSMEQSIANFFPGTSPQVQLNPALMIQFPDGSQISANQMTGQTWVGNTLTFPYNGSTWALSPQVNGIYQATQLSGLGSYKQFSQPNDDPFIRSLMRPR